MGMLEVGDVLVGCLVCDEGEVVLFGLGCVFFVVDMNVLVVIFYILGLIGWFKGVMLSYVNLWLGVILVVYFLKLEFFDWVLGVLLLLFDYG